MSLSRLAAKCRACPRVDICDHKRMEALGALPLPVNQTLVFDQPTIEVDINVIAGQITREINFPIKRHSRMAT